MSPTQLVLVQCIQESLSWLPLTLTVLFFSHWAKSILTLIPKDFCSMNFAKPWTGIDPIGERLLFAWWTMLATTPHQRPRSISRSSKCQWFIWPSTPTVPHLASSSSHTSKEISSMRWKLKPESCKYDNLIILPSSFENVVNGVQDRMNKMRTSAFIRFWKFAVLGQFKYLCLEPIWKRLSFFVIRINSQNYNI